jgi:hypothetical protein
MQVCRLKRGSGRDQANQKQPRGAVGQRRLADLPHRALVGASGLCLITVISSCAERSVYQGPQRLALFEEA